VIRAKAEIEEVGGREQIIVTEIPYQVNKAELIKKAADLVNDKKLEGTSDIRDESDRNGMRIVFELKRDAISNVVLNKLYKFTALQTSFSVNNICLVNGRPEMVNIKDLISNFIEFRHEVVIRRTKFDLRKAEERAHILEGLIIASDNIDEVIKIIRASNSPEEARENLIARFNLSEIQSRAIVEMRLRQLTGLEQDKLRAEYADLMLLIADLKEILSNEERRMQIIKDELQYVKDKYGDARKSRIEYAASEMRMEDLIPDEEVVVTISHAGYIKRTSLNEYKVQNRGGMGSKGSTTRDKDFLEHLFVATNHNYLLIFTEKGRCFWMRVYEIPEGEKTSKGRAIQNLIQLPQDDKVKAIIEVRNLADKDYVNNHYIILCTKKGIIKKTCLEEFSRPRVNGVNAITINEGDELLAARLTDGNNEVMMAVKSGRAIRFPEEKVRPTGRGAIGVAGIEVDDETDEVVGLVCVSREDKDRTILVVSQQGYGKRTPIDDYRITNRGGKGVKTINVTEKTGSLVGLMDVLEKEDLIITCKSGVTIRTSIADIREAGRATQGVKLIRLDENDEIAATSKIEEQDVPEEGEIVSNEGIIADDANNASTETGDVSTDDTLNNEGDDTPEA
jgi:DNA gyrase subunit A